MSFRKIFLLISMSAMVAFAVMATGILDAYEQQNMYSGIAKNKYPSQLTTELSLGQFDNKTEGVMTFGPNEVTIRNSRPELFREDRLTLKFFDFSSLGNEYLESSYYICSETRCEKVTDLSDSLIEVLHSNQKT